jgi:hypothetical protein
MLPKNKLIDGDVLLNDVLEDEMNEMNEEFMEDCEDLVGEPEEEESQDDLPW